jgi:hypothetical protein
MLAFKIADGFLHGDILEIVSRSVGVCSTALSIVLESGVTAPAVQAFE